MHYRFDEFEFRLDSFELFKRGENKKLQRQPARLLALLLEARGQVLSRDKILTELWGEDTFIEVDANINFAVRQLRRALGDSAADPKYVETLPRLGYRFVAEARVERLEPSGSEAQRVNGFPAWRDSSPVRGAWRYALWAAAGIMMLVLGFGLGSWRDRERRQQPPTLRVAPLFSTEPSGVSDAFGAGLREQLVSSLVRSYKGQVNVYSGSTASDDRSASHGFLLTGSAARLSDALARVDLRLSSSDGRSLWADSYEGSVAGLRDWSGNLPVKIAMALPRDVARLSLARSLAQSVDDVGYGKFLRGVYRTQTIFGSRDPELYRRGVEDLERRCRDRS